MTTDQPGRPFLRSWIVRVAAGEALGFAIATAAAVSMIVLAAPSALAVPVTVLGGAAEGAVLASAQFGAMRVDRPPRGLWVGATALAAAVAWTLGMMPSTLGLDVGDPVVLGLVVAGGILLLASIPVAQALVLRRAGSVRWVLVNVGAWAVAILWTAAPSPFIDERTPVATVVAAYVVAGVLMAVTVAALTAPAAKRLFDGPERVARHVAHDAHAVVSAPRP